MSSPQSDLLVVLTFDCGTFRGSNILKNFSCMIICDRGIIVGEREIPKPFQCSCCWTKFLYLHRTAKPNSYICFHVVAELHDNFFLVKFQSWPNSSFGLCDKTTQESSVTVCDFASNSLGVRVVVDCNSVCYS